MAAGKSPSPVYEKRTTILRPRIDVPLWRRGISATRGKNNSIEETPGEALLINQRRRRLLKNIFLISLTKSASYLSADTIMNNWSDANLKTVRCVLSNALSILLTPLFVPLILRIFTLRTSVRLAILWMTLTVLTTYRPFPYVFVVQILFLALAESILRVAVPIYMIRIAKVWSRINGLDLGTSVLRVFALNGLPRQLRRVLAATVQHLRPEDPRAKDYSSPSKNGTRNVSCGNSYRSPGEDFATNHVYDVKYRINDEILMPSIIVGGVSVLLAIVLTTILDRLDDPTKSDFGDRPRVTGSIDVFLQLCRPRVTYLLGISIYEPLAGIVRRDYLEAYANCALRSSDDRAILVVVVVVVVVALAAVHATLSAEIFLDVLGMLGSVLSTIAIFTLIFILLSCFPAAQTLHVLTIFTIFYVIQYWISVYELLVVLLTEKLIGDEEIPAWSFRATVFSFGSTLGLAFRYTRAATELGVILIVGIFVIFMTILLRRETEKEFGATFMNEKIVGALVRKSKAWIADSRTDLGRAIDHGGTILWIETFWRRTIRRIDRPASHRDSDGPNDRTKFPRAENR